MARLQDKGIIITGAAQGMGETHARLCLAEGAKVVLTDINAEKGEALAKELGDNALFIKHDVHKSWVYCPAFFGAWKSFKTF
ncbi:SDR family NAD(P)-dependent oxidoreductase [Psychrobacter sp. VH5]|uniref:SDR family NAD(P)-dependent oxidoreductase n=1 Tax=Psychrobacter sp. VH5 TaxID=3423439 RepID=UPI003D64801A